MARRKTRRTPARRRSTGVNVVNAAQTYLQTAIITRSAFNTNPIEFLTGFQYTPAGTKVTTVPFGTTGYTYDVTTEVPAGFGYKPIENGTALTLPELMGFDAPDGTAVAFGSGGMEAIKANIALNGGLFKPVVNTILLNAGFAVGKKLLGKQRRLANKGAKMAGLSSMIKF